MEFDYYVNFILIILSAFISIHYILNKCKNRNKSIDLIPGLKKSDETFDNLLEGDKCLSFPRFLAKLHDKFGDIAKFYWQDTIVVSVCSENMFKGVQKLFDKPVLVLGNLKEIVGENCIQFSNGEEGWSRRKIYDKSFHHATLIRYITDIENIGQQNLEDLKLQKSPIKSIFQMCFSMTIKAIFKSCILSSDQNEEFYENIINLYKRLFYGLEKRLIKGETHIDNEIEFIKDKTEFYSILRNILNERKILLENDNIKEEQLLLIDQMILYHKDFDRNIIENEVFAYLIGGFHNSGNALAWCLYYLSIHNDVQEKLHKEICENPFQFSNTMDCYKTILDLKYLRACIDETLRLSQIASFSARVSNEDICVGKYIIPANTPIILALGVSLKDNRIFQNNENFIPERFLQNNFPSLSYVPFGFAGKRKCPAERYAYLELSIFLIQLIKKFSFSLNTSKQGENKVYGLIIRMDEDVSINFQER